MQKEKSEKQNEDRVAHESQLISLPNSVKTRVVVSKLRSHQNHLRLITVSDSVDQDNNSHFQQVPR